MAAQVDSVNILCSAKVQSHPENTVGLLTTAGKSARILISATHDLGKVFACLHDVKLDGTSDLMAGIQKAQLALKHRQNVVQRQRIVAFVSSPIKEDQETLVRLGKNLKKNGVAVDVVHVGDDTNGDNVRKLDAFHNAVNSNSNSHILHVEPGAGVLADILMNSEIYAERDAGGGGAASGGDGGAGGGAGGSGGEGFEFGVDPAVDPELAMVLRISMEEERARQEAANREAAAAAGGESGTAPGGGSGSAPAASGGEGGGTYDDDADLYGTGSGEREGGNQMEVEDAEEDEDAMLREAIAMSQAGADAASATAAGASAEEGEDEEMDEEMRRAIEMSKADFDEQSQKKESK